MLPTVFEHFVTESPVSVMARGLMEQIYGSERMNRLFEENA